MATLPVPRTWTVGELLTAAKLNTDLRNGLNFLLAKPLAILRKSLTQSVATAANPDVTWDVEDIDRDGGHDNSTNPARYTAQTAGYYSCRCRIDWGSGVTGGTYTLSIRKSNTFQAAQSVLPTGASGSSTVNEIWGTFFLSVGDYEAVDVTQNSGATRVFGGSTSTRFELEWISAS